MRPISISHLLYGAAALSTAAAHPHSFQDDTPLPLVIWHGTAPTAPSPHPAPANTSNPTGLGDSSDSDGMHQIAELADAVNPGTFVYTVQLGQDANADRTASFYGNVTAQLDEVCEALAAHPILSTAPAIDAIGFSQGGLFLRGYAERCSSPPIRSLVTFGSPHTGITEFKDCGAADLLCRGAMALLRFNTWSAFVQSRLVPAQYFRDPADYDAYLASSNLLADINNERPEKNPIYNENLANLEKLAMYKFEDDTTLIPRESAWFGDVNGTDATPLRETRLYGEDWLGLRELDERGALEFRTVPGEHMQIEEGALREAMGAYFGPFGRTFGPVVGDDEL